MLKKPCEKSRRRENLGGVEIREFTQASSTSNGTQVFIIIFLYISYNL